MISDCRFPNEISSIRNAGGKIVWVRRGPLPAWYDLALEHNRGSEEANIQLAKLKIHASETAWVGTDFDCVIDNNGSIEDLFKQSELLVRNQQQDHLVAI